MKKYYLNLQLFAGEKTEKATPKRRQEARKKGQVAKSNEVNSFLLLLAVIVLLRILLPNMIGKIENYVENLWSTFTYESFTVENITPILIKLLYLTIELLLPIILSVVVLGILANILQIGFLFTTEPLKFKFSRINPVEGFKRIFSKRSLVELVKSIIKITLIGWITYSGLKNKINNFPFLMDMNLKGIIVFIGGTLFSVIWKIIILLAFLALFDYLYQKYEYESSLKMSKQEVKDEYKNIEGDPLIKSKIKERQRQMAMNRMMQEVPKADVVITNPTHFAVALKYDSSNMDAPMVIAKGKDLIALKIKELAQKNNVITVENKILARTLYYSVEVNEYIPEELYQAVAEILAFVYRLKGKV